MGGVINNSKHLKGFGLSLLLILTLGFSQSHAQDGEPDWGDEFNYTGKPDPDKWGYENGFVRNGEPQWYQDDNANVNGTDLVIEVRKEEGETHRLGDYDSPYTSSMLTSATKLHFLYGKLEFRAKIPVSNGSWPAFWTLGSDYRNAQPSTGGTRGWPDCGEIDIMEYYNGLDHHNWLGSVGGWNSQTKSVDDEWASEYHTWVYEWDPDMMKIYLDGEFMNEHPTNGDREWQYPHYMLINVALEPAWWEDAQPDTYIELPIEMYVDYVRYWQDFTPGGQASPVFMAPVSKEISILPDPGGNQIFFNNYQRINNLTVVSVNGNVVHQSSTLESATLNTGDLPPGVYYIKVVDDKGRAFNKRMVKY